MKRSDFLKRLGIGAVAVVVAPRVLAEMPAKEETISSKEYHLNHARKIYKEYTNAELTLYPNNYMRINDIIMCNGNDYVVYYIKPNGHALAKPL